MHTSPDPHGQVGPYSSRHHRLRKQSEGEAGTARGDCELRAPNLSFGEVSECFLQRWWTRGLRQSYLCPHSSQLFLSVDEHILTSIPNVMVRGRGSLAFESYEHNGFNKY
ncbi:hypothetical protein H1C71_011951 [Ictidomys tridecemlineatus]|nr:hypothetical protein H1C71_011951 [Ictidomys tridecemlineatus]